MENIDKTTEQWLETWETSWDLKRIPISRINFQASLNVQNRGDVSLDDDHVLAMMEWLDGPKHSMPPIVVNEAKGAYHIIDGNHRAKATREMDRETVDAYVIKIDDDQFQNMVLAANMRNSKSLTHQERMELARHLANRIGTQPAAAQAGIRPEQLLQEVRVQDGRKKLSEALDIDPSAVSRSKAEALNRLDVNQIKALGKVVRDATKAELELSVRNILAVAASDQQDQAVRESGRLEQVQRDKKRPNSRSRSKSMTTNKARTELMKINKFLKENPSAWNDPELVSEVLATVSLAQETVNRAA